MVNISPISFQSCNCNSSPKKAVNFGSALTDTADEFKQQSDQVNELKSLSQSGDTPGPIKGLLKLAFVAGTAVLSYGTYKALLPKAISTIAETAAKVKPKNSEQLASQAKQAATVISKPVNAAIASISKKVAEFRATLKPESKLAKALDKTEALYTKHVAPVVTSAKEKLASVFTTSKVAKAATEGSAAAVGITAGVEALDDVSEKHEDA